MTALTTFQKVPYPVGTDPLGDTDLRIKAIADWIEDARSNRAKVYPNAALSVVTATPTLVPFTGEVYDPKNLHDNATNNTRITAAKAGWYRVTAQVMWATNATGWRYLTLIANGVVFAQQLDMAATGTEVRHQITGTALLAVGGYVQLQVAHSAGVNLALTTDQTSSWFEAEWIGEA